MHQPVETDGLPRLLHLFKKSEKGLYFATHANIMQHKLTLIDALQIEKLSNPSGSMTINQKYCMHKLN